VTLQSNSINPTTLRETTSAGATEQIALNIPANGVQTAVVGGTKTAGDTLTITAYDAGLSGGSQAINYTVLGGDTLTSIATGLATSINANANLAAVGVTASSSSTVLNLKSTSISNTTYSKSLSGGATETITLAPATSVSQYSYNNLNELTAIAPGGACKFEATTNKALKSATVNSNPATLNWTKNFAGNATLANGANTVPVGATDGANSTVTNNNQVGVTGPSSASLTFDANGNMTSDGTNTYAWDAEDRLIKITYSGSGNYSQILYDAEGIKGQITEIVASSLTSTKQFVNAGTRIGEERDASSAVIKKFFGSGQTISNSSYCYAFDHLGSVREMIDSSGVVQARYDYSLYGQKTKLAGALDSDFQYAGYYMHQPSGFNLTVCRAYNSLQGRWINRDPINEQGGLNLYRYAINRPLNVIDPSGLFDLNQEIPLQEMAEIFGTDVKNLQGGCFDLVNAEGHFEFGRRPEYTRDAHCFNTLGEAKEDGKRCKCPVIFAKKGNRAPGSSPNTRGQVPFDTIGFSPVDYVTLHSGKNGGWYDLERHGVGSHNFGHYRGNGDEPPYLPNYPQTIYCSRCKN